LPKPIAPPPPPPFCDAEEEEERQRLDEDRHPDVRAFLGTRVHDDALRAQPFDQVGIVQRVGAKLVVIGVGAGDGVRRNGDIADRSFIDLVQEGRIGDHLSLRLGRRAIEQLDENRQRHQDADPDQQALHPRVAAVIFGAVLLVVVVHADVLPLSPPKIGLARLMAMEQRRSV
jgi:hypothetical protein